jgi:hypothetical protein
MNPSLRSGLLWAFCAGLLLTFGFLGMVYVATLLAQARSDPASVREMQVALVIYARVVLVKGLLPQLLIALALWPALDRLFSFGSRGRWGEVLGLSGSALLAALIVAPTLLPLDLDLLPAVKFRSAGNFVVSVLEMTAAVAAATLLPRWILPGLRARRP